VAPRGLPPDVYSRLASAIGVMMLEPRHAQALRATGLSYVGLNGPKARAYVEDEIVRTARLIARLGGEASRRP
jgi:tripartite-type tricarboxylate transporter receptor subunit TctC